MRDGGTGGVRRWAHTAIATAVAIVAQALPAPGVHAPDPIALGDRVSALSWLGMFADWEAPRLPLVDGELIRWLALASVLAAISLGGTATARARMVVRYAVLAGLLCAAVASGWDTYSVWARLGVGWPAAVLVAYVCGAVLIWLLAGWIDAYGAGQGALVLLLAQTLVMGAGDLASANAPSASGVSVVDVVIVGLPSLALCVGLALRTPSAWPVKVAGGLAMTSPLDALGLQILGIALLSPAALASTGVVPEWLGVPVRFALGIAGLAVVWGALRRAGVVRERHLGWLVLAAVLLAAELGWPVLAASHLGPEARTTRSDRVDIALGATEVVLVGRGEAAADAAVIASRLERISLHADVLDTASGRIHLSIAYASDLRRVLEVVGARGTLSVRAVDATSPTPLSPAIFDAREVLSATPASTPEQAGLVLELSTAGAARVREQTDAHPNQQFALLLDERVTARATGQQTGTTMRFTMGSPRGDPDVVRRAAAVAATLSSSTLSSAWSVQTLRAGGQSAR